MDVAAQLREALRPDAPPDAVDSALRLLATAVLGVPSGRADVDAVYLGDVSRGGSRSMQRDHAARLAMLADASFGDADAEAYAAAVALRVPAAAAAVAASTGADDRSAGVTELARLAAVLGAIISSRPTAARAAPIEVAVARVVASLAAAREPPRGCALDARAPAAEALRKAAFVLRYLVPAPETPRTGAALTRGVWGACARAREIAEPRRPPPPAVAEDAAELAATIAAAAHRSYLGAPWAAAARTALRACAAAGALLVALWLPEALPARLTAALLLPLHAATGATDASARLQPWRPLLSAALVCACAVLAAVAAARWRGAAAHRAAAAHAFLASDADVVAVLSAPPPVAAEPGADGGSAPVAAAVESDGSAGRADAPAAAPAPAAAGVSPRPRDGGDAEAEEELPPPAALEELLALEEGQVLAETDDGSLVVLTRGEAEALLGADAANELSRQTATLLRAAAARLTMASATSAAGAGRSGGGAALALTDDVDDDSGTPTPGAPGSPAAALGSRPLAAAGSGGNGARAAPGAAAVSAVPRLRAPAPSRASLPPPAPEARLPSEASAASAAPHPSPSAFASASSATATHVLDDATVVSGDAHVHPPPPRARSSAAAAAAGAASPAQAPSPPPNAAPPAPPPAAEVADLANAIAVPPAVATDMLVALAAATELMAAASADAASPPPLAVALLPPAFLPTLLELYRRLVAIGEEGMAQGVADRIVVVGELVARAALRDEDEAAAAAGPAQTAVAATPAERPAHMDDVSEVGVETATRPTA